MLAAAPFSNPCFSVPSVVKKSLTTDFTDGHGWFWISIGDAFDLETGMFEVEKEGCFESRDVEVSEHLGNMVFVEGADDLGVDDDGLIDNKIRNEVADELFVVVDGVLLLLLADEVLFGEFDHEGAFIELFIEAGLEFVQHLHGGTDDDFSELFVVIEHGWIFLTTDGTDDHG